MMQRGELVPDLLIVALLMPAILRAADDGGYVLDGYPTIRPPGGGERDLADRKERQADLVIYLDVPEDELIRRILARAASKAAPTTRPRSSPAGCECSGRQLVR